MIILFVRATCKYHNLHTIAIQYGIRSFVIGFAALHSNISRYQCCHCNIFYSDFVQFRGDETSVFIYEMFILKRQVSLQLRISTTEYCWYFTEKLIVQNILLHLQFNIDSNIKYSRLYMADLTTFQTTQM